MVRPPILVMLALVACRDAPLIRADLAGYSGGQGTPFLVFAARDPGPASVDGPGGPLTVEPQAGSATYAADGGELEVWTYDPGVLAAGAWTVDVGGAVGALLVQDDPRVGVLSRGLQFFAAQRCGPGASTLHGACHLYASVTDASSETSSGDGLRVSSEPDRDVCGLDGADLADGTHAPVDVEGGWHDAGDYIKFVHTTSFTVALVLGTYLRDPAAWPDQDGDGAPDVLAAMEPGVRWLIAAHPDADTLVYQVGDERDHDYWRLPEDDTRDPIAGLAQRPAYACGDACANVAGRSAAALALAAEAWAGRDDLLVAAATRSATSLYALGVSRPGVQPTCPADFYPEDSYADDMELAAAALYSLTGDDAYRADAVALAGEARDAGPPSYADVQVLADAWLARAEAATGQPVAPSQVTERAVAVRAAFAASAAADPTQWAGEGTWGSVATAAGYANACAWLYDVDGDDACAADARWQVHAALGANPFGVPYMVGVDDIGPKAISSPLTDVGGEPEIGAVVGGPASRATMREGGISDPRRDPYADLQSDAMVYHDDVDDYVSNEAALDYTAQLLCAVAAWDGP